MTDEPPRPKHVRSLSTSTVIYKPPTNPTPPPSKIPRKPRPPTQPKKATNATAAKPKINVESPDSKLVPRTVTNSRSATPAFKVKGSFEFKSQQPTNRLVPITKSATPNSAPLPPCKPPPDRLEKAAAAEKARALLKVDWILIETKMPTGKDAESTKRRRLLYKQFDILGDGRITVASTHKTITSVLNMWNMFPPQVVQLAHQAAAAYTGDGPPPKFSKREKVVGEFVDWNKFRMLLVYLKQHLELWVIFDALNVSRDGHLKEQEFIDNFHLLVQYGFNFPDPTKCYSEMKVTKSGVGGVLFKDFAHWGLTKKLHLENVQAAHDEKSAADGDSDPPSRASESKLIRQSSDEKEVNKDNVQSNTASSNGKGSSSAVSNSGGNCESLTVVDSHEGDGLGSCTPQSPGSAPVYAPRSSQTNSEVGLFGRLSHSAASSPPPRSSHSSSPPPTLLSSSPSHPRMSSSHNPPAPPIVSPRVPEIKITPPPIPPKPQLPPRVQVTPPDGLPAGPSLTALAALPSTNANTARNSPDYVEEGEASENGDDEEGEGDQDEEDIDAEEEADVAADRTRERKTVEEELASMRSTESERIAEYASLEFEVVRRVADKVVKGVIRDFSARGGRGALCFTDTLAYMENCMYEAEEEEYEEEEKAREAELETSEEDDDCDPFFPSWLETTEGEYNSDNDGQFMERVQEAECEVCEDKHPAQIRCLECEENMCEKLGLAHKKSKIGKDHTMGTPKFELKPVEPQRKSSAEENLERAAAEKISAFKMMMDAKVKNLRTGRPVVQMPGEQRLRVGPRAWGKVTVKCELCEEQHAATMFCVNCGQNMCDRLAAVHLKSKIGRQHELKPV